MFLLWNYKTGDCSFEQQNFKVKPLYNKRLLPLGIMSGADINFL